MIDNSTSDEFGTEASPDTLGAPEYLCYYVLEQFQDEWDDGVPRSVFLHGSCICDRMLQDVVNLDVETPRYWYIFGEVVDEHSLCSDFYQRSAAPHRDGPVYAPSPEVTKFDFDISNTVMRQIETAGDLTVVELTSKEPAAVERHVVQEFAPTEFIREYTALRETLEGCDHDAQTTLGEFEPTINSVRQQVLQHVDGLERTYPRADYPEMAPHFDTWVRTVRELLEGERPFALIDRLVDSLIEAMCKVEIRFHHRQHVDDRRVRDWEREKIDVKEKFATQLEDLQRDLVTNPRTSDGGLEFEGSGRPLDDTRSGDVR
jgi:hypothetical protein